LFFCNFFNAIGQILHDEISTALLELSQVEERNQNLAKDNAKLLQRWLDAKQVEANRMNEANEFYESMRSRRDEVLSWRDNSYNGDVNLPADAVASSGATRPTSGSGKGSGSLQSQAATTKNGPLSPASKRVDQTPNG
jgi:autophagy-related protein 16